MAAPSVRAIDAAGDEVARLYAEYGAKLHRFCLGRLRSNEEAEDAVQSTFLRVYTALRQGTVPRYEAAWLYKIAHNVCLSRIESSARRARLESPQDFALLEEELAAPAGRRDELVGLADALASMPLNLRQAILLREWQGLSYAEIAEALGVTVSAVESLIFRARRHLANALVEPARRVAGALNLPWIFGGLRSLFAGLRTGAGMSAGTKVAAGVALLAIGGTGAGLGLTVGASGSVGPSVSVRPTPRSTALVAVAVANPALPRGELVAVASRSGAPSRRSAARPLGAARPHAAAHSAAPPAGRAAASAPRAPTRRLPVTRRVPVTPPPIPGQPPATGPTAPPATTPRTGTTSPPTPPTVSVPAITVLPVPTVVSTPIATVTVPVVTVTVVVPAIPPVTTPVLTVTLPSVSVPTVTLP